MLRYKSYFKGPVLGQLLHKTSYLPLAYKLPDEQILLFILCVCALHV